jgi:hypothetical protein
VVDFALTFGDAHAVIQRVLDAISSELPPK